MIRLVTGAPGAGKTCFTLKAVRRLEIDELKNGLNRLTVFVNIPINEENCPFENWESVKKTEEEMSYFDWREYPDGTRFVYDEAQYSFPSKNAASNRSPIVKDLTIHRHRGFDFILITQGPNLIDTFIHPLIEFHEHYDNWLGTKLVKKRTWNCVNKVPLPPTSESNAEKDLFRLPKEVFPWYQSTSLDTRKPRIPKKLFYMIGLGFASMALVMFLMKSMYSRVMPDEAQEQEELVQPNDNAPDIGVIFRKSEGVTYPAYLTIERRMIRFNSAQYEASTGVYNLSGVNYQISQQAFREALKTDCFAYFKGGRCLER